MKFRYIYENKLGSSRYQRVMIVLEKFDYEYLYRIGTNLYG